MALRLLEMVLPEHHVGELQQLLQDKPTIEVWYDRISEKQTLIMILSTVEETEHLMDLLDQHFSMAPGFRLILLPVAASLPRVEEPEAEPRQEGAPLEANQNQERISREELYEAAKDMARLTRIYLGMVVLSTIVAAIGLLNNSVAVIIGAMVIAPLLGPIIAQAMGATLGDTDLVRLALKTNIVGLCLGLALAVLLGLFMQVNPGGSQLADRTVIGLGDLTVALASGSAGALAFTAGASTVLVGVMVAVALLPPLAALGLFLGSGHFLQASGAALLLLSNILCVNLAGVVVFWLQGVRPTTWWEEKQARRAVKISIAVSATLLTLLVLAILLSRRVAKLNFG